MAQDRRVPWGWLNLALGLLALALVATAVVVWTRPATGGTGDGAARELSRQQWEVTEAASAEVEAFLTVDHEAMTEVVAQVMDGATGTFRDEYDAGRARLVARTAASDVTARAVVRAVALGRVTSSTAEVLVAADARVTNDQSRGREQLRQHRLRLVMVERDGRWLTEQLEFVR
ncbi:hypothetical protein [Nocardioides aurantiacus]|uniref:Mce-associated membrane protein n=1 Tax=Nocardioides aurantiacus TaxID=86796 RepID=A0A3N2CUW6_9ACTN|nr:hypothetical protein [Nocardioides aurantiacus]ROR91279.1 Mce-associated membrane protein [Nocardioides aurantiacus]